MRTSIKPTPAETDQAVEAFRRAVELEPDLAEAWAGLSEIYSLRIELAVGDPSEELARARATARRALKLDPTRPEGHHAFGLTLMLADRRLAEAEATFREAIRLLPSYARGWHSLSWALLVQGHPEEAASATLRAIQIEPRWVAPRKAYATVQLATGCEQEALEAIRQAKALSPPHHPEASGIELTILMELNRHQDARRTFRELFRMRGALGAPFDEAYARGGLREAMRLGIESETEPRSWFAMALRCAWLKDYACSLAALERSAIEDEPENLVTDVYPAFRPLRANPRYREILERLGLAGDPDLRRVEKQIRTS